jgi:hypothetical protein
LILAYAWYVSISSLLVRLHWFRSNYTGRPAAESSGKQK